MTSVDHTDVRPCVGRVATAPSVVKRVGFSLIELMITVAIVAILAAVAYPSYIEYVARGHRTELKGQMAAAQQWMERYYSEHYAYDSTAAPTTTATGVFASQAFAQSPPVGQGAAQYTVGPPTVTGGQSYTLTATRTGAMANDPCGDLSITNTGVKTVTGWGSRYADGPAAVAACWN
jgi:type IV pilus assembly protein PilE